MGYGLVCDFKHAVIPLTPRLSSFLPVVALAGAPSGRNAVLEQREDVGPGPCEGISRASVGNPSCLKPT